MFYQVSEFKKKKGKAFMNKVVVTRWWEKKKNPDFLIVKNSEKIEGGE